MDKLREAGLIGDGLFVVDTPELRDRYNECLVRLGKPRTTLTSFDVDITGWSPQIAQELNDFDYLMDDTTRSGIILSPRQAELPIFRPMHSFDRLAFEMLFRDAMRQISTVTARTAIWVDGTLEISRIQKPETLLTLENYLLECHDLIGMMNAAEDQINGSLLLIRFPIPTKRVGKMLRIAQK
jgi:hypothetical protein